MVKRILMVVVSSFAMMACGPGAKIDGKQGAAEALFAGSQPTKANTAASPVDISANCPEGGTASITGAGVSVNIGGGGAGVGTNFNMKYNGCGVARSDLGVAIYNGELTFSQNITAASGNASISQAFKGRVLVQGAYDDFLDVDVSQQVAVGDLGASGTGVSVILKGTISTTEGTFTYDESINVTAGKISAKINASK
ncbi:MAG: hypothetical protein Q8L48_18365 [Archangium sp.]|nr:hypothetical protein [Archangium sp.]